VAQRVFSPLSTTATAVSFAAVYSGHRPREVEEYEL
jgi:hypothetical protein